MLNTKDIYKLIEERKIDTPCFLLDMDAIGANAQNFRSAWQKQFSTISFHYSFKTNSLVPVIAEIKRQGYNCEVASQLELEWALVAGFKNEQIIFNGPVKTDEGLQLALKNNVILSVDNMEELNRCFGLATNKRAKLNILLRLSTYYRDDKGYTSRFGFTKKEIVAAIQLCEKHGVPILGIHYHCGKHIPIEKHALMLEQTISIIKKYRAAFIPQFIVDIGGGFDAHIDTPKNKKLLKECITAIRNSFLAHQFQPHEYKLVLEPGRCLVEQYGFFVSKVCCTKTRNKKKCLIVDAGKDNLPSLDVHNDRTFSMSDSKSVEVYDIYGKNCFEMDILGRNIKCHKDPSHIVFSDAGSYDISSSRVWLSAFPKVYCKYNSEIAKCLMRKI